MKRSVLAALVGLLVSSAVARAAEPVTLTIDSGKVLNRIDEKIYGHFLEHIYHSCNGGLWGEIIWDRSFESGGTEKKPARAPHWEKYGQGTITLAKEKALNGDQCQKIVCEQGEAGLRQAPVCLRQGETYHGSLWVRGEAPEGLVVRLVDAGKTLAEKRLPAPGQEWQERKFELKPETSADNAAIELGLVGKGQVWMDQVSLMSESARANGGFRPDLLKAVAELKPPVIRWPGGCFASYYRWKSGVGPQHKRIKYPQAMWDDVDINSFGTDEFIALCRRVGAEPLIVVCIGMHHPRTMRDEFCQEACDWVEYCNGPATSKWGKVRADNGHPEPYGVKYWEIDNEVWKLKHDDYVSVVRQFIPAMKKVDPSIKTIACGSGQLGGYWGRGDAAVINGCADLIDYLSLHHYEDARKFASGVAAAEGFWRDRGGMMAASKNPKMQIYVSEWNVQSTDWRTGLYAGAALNVFERCGDCVGIAGPALFLRHVSAKDWDNAFINFDHRTWFPAPNYVVMKLWRDHYAPQRVELGGKTGPLDALATRSADGSTVYLKAVNPGEQEVAVVLNLKDDFPVAGATMQVVAADSLRTRNSLENPSKIAPAAASVEVAGQTVRFKLPRLSAGVVTVKKR